MGEFFKPWRRKIGVVTLVIASLFMVGWMRSEVKADWFHFSSGQFTYEGFISFRGNLIWNRFRHTDKTGTPPDVILDRGHNVLDYIIAHLNDNPFEGEQSWNICGLCKCDFTAIEFSLTALKIPYWLIVLPLTLITAFLFLTKPHKSTQMKIIEPTSNEGATS